MQICMGVLKLVCLPGPLIWCTHSMHRYFSNSRTVQIFCFTEFFLLRPAKSKVDESEHIKKNSAKIWFSFTWGADLKAKKIKIFVWYSQSYLNFLWFHAMLIEAFKITMNFAEISAAFWILAIGLLSHSSL